MEKFWVAEGVSPVGTAGWEGRREIFFFLNLINLI